MKDYTNWLPGTVLAFLFKKNSVISKFMLPHKLWTGCTAMALQNIKESKTLTSTEKDI